MANLNISYHNNLFISLNKQNINDDVVIINSKIPNKRKQKLISKRKNDNTIIIENNKIKII